jgi:hypothetical protein
LFLTALELGGTTMNRVKTLLLISMVITTSFLVIGCGLIGTWSASSEDRLDLQDHLPEWLTLAHRVQAAEEQIIETEGDDRNLETETVPTVNQPASTQPSSTQPAQQNEQPAQTGTPSWQQPGTMEYIAKLQLDQVVFHYKRLNSKIADLEDEKDKTKEEELIALKKERSERYEAMNEVAISIGLNLEKEYGIKPPPVEKSATDKAHWFDDSKGSGWEDGWKIN